jgi:hypothetical protein
VPQPFHLVTERKNNPVWFVSPLVPERQKWLIGPVIENLPF